MLDITLAELPFLVGGAMVQCRFLASIVALKKERGSSWSCSTARLWTGIPFHHSILIEQMDVFPYCDNYTLLDTLSPSRSHMLLVYNSLLKLICLSVQCLCWIPGGDGGRRRRLEDCRYVPRPAPVLYRDHNGDWKRDQELWGHYAAAANSLLRSVSQTLCKLGAYPSPRITLFLRKDIFTVPFLMHSLSLALRELREECGFTGTVRGISPGVTYEPGMTCERVKRKYVLLLHYNGV